MIYEEFSERMDAGYYREGMRLWIYEFHFGNIEGRISRHTPPTEFEIGEHSWLNKVSSKTGRTLTTSMYVSHEAYHEGEFPDSRYVAQIFETKEEAVAAYHRSIDFWLDKVGEHRARMNAQLSRQIVYISDYRDKAPQ